MLDESFFTVVARRQTAPMHITRTVVFNLNHPILKGHFPNNPIVPGVCSVEIFRQFVAEMLESRVRIDTVKNMKFVKLMEPAEGKCFDFDIEVKRGEEDRLTAKLMISDAGEVVVKASFICITR